MSSSREIKDFVSAFQAGWKMMEDSEYKKALMDYYRRGGKGGSGSVGDEELSKYDPRLKPEETSLFGRLFGRTDDGTPKLEGFERGLARLNADTARRIELGDFEGAQKNAKAIELGTRMQRGYDRNVNPGADKAAPKVTPKSNGRGASLGDRDVNPQSGLVPRLTALEVPPQPTTPAVAQEDSTPPAEPAVADANTDGIQPQVNWDDGVELSRGGLVPTRSYSLGGPTTGSVTARPPQALPTEAAPVAEDDTEASSDELTPEDRAKLRTMSNVGVALGVTALDRHFGRPPAMANADPEYSRKVQDFAQGKDAASEEDVQALNAVVDPDGKLPADLRSQARFAAVAMRAKEDPEAASKVAAQLAIYEKSRSQTLGTLASRAFTAGDVESGVRLLSDAVNNHNLEGYRVDPRINEDGSVTAAMYRDGNPIGEQTLSGVQLADLSKDISSGLFTKGMQGAFAEGKAFLESQKHTGKGGAGGSGKDDFNASIDKLEAAASNFKGVQQSLEGKPTDKDGLPKDPAARKMFEDAQNQLDAARRDFRVHGMANKGRSGSAQTLEALRKTSEEIIKGARPIRPKEAVPTSGASDSSRADGTTKGSGFFGPITRPDGKVSTEVSVGVNIDGKEREIPLMVPTLTKPELSYILNNDPSSPDFQKAMPKSIMDKAVSYAQERIKNGKSPFAGSGERVALPGDVRPAPASNGAIPMPPQRPAELGGQPAVQPSRITSIRAAAQPTVNENTYTGMGDYTGVGSPGMAVPPPAILDRANDAIARGADPQQVLKRLLENGYAVEGQ